MVRGQQEQVEQRQVGCDLGLPAQQVQVVLEPQGTPARLDLGAQRAVPEIDEVEIRSLRQDPGSHLDEIERCLLGLEVGHRADHRGLGSDPQLCPQTPPGVRIEAEVLEHDAAADQLDPGAGEQPGLEAALLITAADADVGVGPVGEDALDRLVSVAKRGGLPVVEGEAVHAVDHGVGSHLPRGQPSQHAGLAAVGVDDQGPG